MVIDSISGEASWIDDEAEGLGQPVKSIEQATDFRMRTKTDAKVQNSFTYKMVGALRNVFSDCTVKTQ